MKADPALADLLPAALNGTDCLALAYTLNGTPHRLWLWRDGAPGPGGGRICGLGERDMPKTSTVTQTGIPAFPAHLLHSIAGQLARGAVDMTGEVVTACEVEAIREAHGARCRDCQRREADREWDADAKPAPTSRARPAPSAPTLRRRYRAAIPPETPQNAA